MKEPRDSQLYQLVRAATLEAGVRIKELLEADHHILSYDRFPRLSYFETGFPHIRHEILSSVPDYTNAFAGRPGELAGPIIYSSLDSFNALFEYSWRHQRLRSMFLPPDAREDELARRIFEIMVAELPLHILDRHLHTREGSIDDDVLLDIYLELEAGIFQDTLPVDIIIPVVLTRFYTTESVQLSGDIRLEMMDNSFNRARVLRTTSGPPLMRSY